MESMDNIMNRENQMTNFYNHNHQNAESEMGNYFTQNLATKSFMKSFCNDDSLQTRNVSTIAKPEFKETAQLGQQIHR